MLRRALLPLALLACAPAAQESAHVPEAVVVESIGKHEEAPFIPEAPRPALVGPRQAVGPTEPDVLSISLEQGTGIPMAPTPKVGFDTNAIAVALARLRLDECAVPGDSGGHGHVTMVFEPSGRIDTVMLDRGAFRGTKTGDCIVRTHETIVVPPFMGPRVIVGKTIWLRTAQNP